MAALIVFALSAAFLAVHWWLMAADRVRDPNPCIRWLVASSGPWTAAIVGWLTLVGLAVALRPIADDWHFIAASAWLVLWVPVRIVRHHNPYPDYPQHIDENKKNAARPD